MDCGARSIIVDLSSAESVDSTIVGAVVTARTTQDGERLVAAIVAPTHYAGTRLVRLVGVGSAVPVYATRADAVAAVRGHTA